MSVDRQDSHVIGYVEANLGSLYQIRQMYSGCM
jgi:hypothetical protein